MSSKETKLNKCDCYLSSCEKDCEVNHTHKGMYCIKCEPRRFVEEFDRTTSSEPILSQCCKAKLQECNFKTGDTYFKHSVCEKCLIPQFDHISQATKMVELSKCCSKPKVANYSDEGTGCYLCQGCLGEFIPIDNLSQKDFQPNCKPILSQCCGKIARLSISTRHGRRLFCELCGSPFIPQLPTSNDISSRLEVSEKESELLICTNCKKETNYYYIKIFKSIGDLADSKLVCWNCGGKLEIQASIEKECEHYSDCAIHNEPAYPNGECNCGGYVSPLPTEDWTIEFDERWLPYKYAEVGRCLPEIKSFIQSQIEAERVRAFKEGYTKGVNDTHDVLEPLKIAKNNFDVGREQGKVEERQRIVKMIEGECLLADNRTRRLLKELLANLNKNE